MAALQPLGGLLPGVGAVLSAADQVNRAVRPLTRADEEERARRALRANQEAAARQLRERQRVETLESREQAELDRQRLAAETEQAEQTRRDALRRVTARQRAQFGASGISSSGGSAEAVLLGLFEESDADRRRREASDRLRRQAIGQDLAQQRRRNLLEQTQLADRQRLQRIQSF